MSLSDEQASAAGSTEDHNLVVALPGAGKTHTMMSFIENLVVEVEHRVVALTFTAAAAAEMKARLAKKLPVAKRKQVYVSTFHSLINKQAKMHPDYKGRKLLSGQEAARTETYLLRQYLTLNKRDPSTKINYECTLSNSKKSSTLLSICRRVLHAITATAPTDSVDWRLHELGDLNEILDFENASSELYEFYVDGLAGMKVWPMDVMCYEVTKGLLEGDVEPINCTHLIVDEYQDTDPVQYCWIRSHGIGGAKITVVGDDDQSIYSFRGAMGYQGMTRFQDDFDVQLHTLTKCFRCSRDILTFAGEMIAFNDDRLDKPMNTQSTEYGSIILGGFPSDEEYLEQIRELIDAHRCGSRAILARTNQELDQIEGYLSTHEIETQRLNGSSVWESDVLKLYLAILLTILDPTSNRHLLNCLVFTHEHRSMINKLQAELNGLGLAHYQGDRSGFNDETQKLFMFCDNESYLASTKDCDKIDALLEGIEKNFKVPDKSVALVKKVLSLWPELTLLRRLQEIEKMTRKRQSKEVQDTLVTITSFHGSKGLEWDLVIVVGLDDDHIPHKMPNQAVTNVEEERRLLYVAMTRAKSKLALLWRSEPTKFIVDALGSIQESDSEMYERVKFLEDAGGDT
ncbi:DNA helicase [Shewanella colwelliana]|uniref:DNA 3'-5' helicase n=1 Tax=Shewanella colwelliana TaxID=23 RepID=A0ABQ4P0D7_SHECO|nr:ATP-dependent helicase [Shewanella colwelliana]GIU40923.1 DNA helicase [Shewanella colwelliana]